MEEELVNPDIENVIGGMIRAEKDMTVNKFKIEFSNALGRDATVAEIAAYYKYSGLFKVAKSPGVGDLNYPTSISTPRFKERSVNTGSSLSFSRNGPPEWTVARAAMSYYPLKKKERIWVEDINSKDGGRFEDVTVVVKYYAPFTHSGSGAQTDTYVNRKFEYVQEDVTFEGMADPLDQKRLEGRHITHQKKIRERKFGH